MFRGSQIPEILTVAGMVDRTLWVFRYRFFDYMKICFVTYVPLMLVMILLWNLNIINLDFLEGSVFTPDLFFFVLFVTVPTLLSDVAVQYFTSYLVRDNEIHWFQAVKKSFGKPLFRYALLRVVGAIVLITIGAMAMFVNLVPFIGFVIYWAIVIGTYTFTLGMSAPLVVEDQLSGVEVIKRNFNLSKSQFIDTLLSAVSLTKIAFAVMVSVVILFLLLSGLVIVLMKGQQTVTVMDNFSERFVFTLILLLAPLMFALFFTPMKSIYFSVLYYNLRAREEGFHLENKVNIYLRELDRIDRAENADATQELEKISATA